MNETLELVSPAAEFRQREVHLSSPLPTLAGRRVALLSNGKWNAADLLEGVAALLEEQYEVVVAVRDAKQHYNHELSPDVREQVINAADFALLAIGD